MVAKLKESVQATIAIAVLVGIFWGVRHQSFSDLTASLEQENGSATRQSRRTDSSHGDSIAATERHPGPRRRFLPNDCRDLPACAEVAEALRLLQAASIQLSAVADTPVGERAGAAQQQYQDAVSRVRADLTRLHALVDPDQYEELCGQMIDGMLSDATARLAAWELIDAGRGLTL